MSVVQFKPRHRKRPVINAAALAEIHARLGAVFAQLGERYGVHAVTTVALSFVAEAIEQACRERGPNDEDWVADLVKRFDQAAFSLPSTAAIRRAAKLRRLVLRLRWLIAMCYVILIGCTP